MAAIRSRYGRGIEWAPATTVYRSREQRWWIGGMGAFVAVWMLGLCVDGIQKDAAAVTLPIVLSGSMPIFFFVPRAVRMSVRADQAGLHVRNLFTSFDLRWDEIKSFHVGGSGMLIITFIDGQTRRAWGCCEAKPSDATEQPQRRADRTAAQRKVARVRSDALRPKGLSRFRARAAVCPGRLVHE